MDKENVMSTYDVVLLSFKKKWNSDTSHSRVELWNITLSEISQTQKDKYCMRYLEQVNS